MLGLGVRQAVKWRVKRWLGRDQVREDLARVAPRGGGAPPSPAPEAPPERVQPKDAADTAPPPGLDRVAIEALLDDMIRPALRSDGGDIELVEVTGLDLHVRLLGSCNGCPSSTSTIRYGVERILREEFPHLGALVVV